MGKCFIVRRGGGADTDGLTAAAGDVLSGKSFLGSGSDEPQSGTMANRGAVSQTLNAGGSYAIPAGYHNGAGVVTANSLAAQTGATASAGVITQGYTAWVNGSYVTGALPVQGGGWVTPTTYNQLTVPANRHVNGDIWVAGDGNLNAANIKKGVTIFGVTGTWSGYVPGVNDLYLYGNNPAGFAKDTSCRDVNITFDGGQITFMATNQNAYGTILATNVNFVGYSTFNIDCYFGGVYGTGVMQVMDKDNGEICRKNFKDFETATVTGSLANFQRNVSLMIRFNNIFNGSCAVIHRVWLS